MADEIKPQEKPRSQHPNAGRIRYIKDQITPTWNETKSVTDISKETPGYWKLRKEYAELLYKKEQEGQIDSLTQILNRRGVEKRLEAEVKTAKRVIEDRRRENEERKKRGEITLDESSAYPISIIFMDLNSLKEHNTVSHAAGDQLLKNIAKGLSEGSKPEDIVGRYGGDEFIVILPKTTGIEAQAFWERKKELLKSMSVWVSAGLAKLDPNNVEESINAAESAQRMAKKIAKSRFEKIGIRDNIMETTLGAVSTAK